MPAGEASVAQYAVSTALNLAYFAPLMVSTNGSTLGKIATTATFFAGGSGGPPLSKLSAYLLPFSISSSVVLIGASVQKIASGTWSRRLYVEAIDCPQERQSQTCDGGASIVTAIAAPRWLPGTRSAHSFFCWAPEFLRAGIPLPLPDPAGQIEKRS
jgi:hypothetical protein